MKPVPAGKHIAFAQNADAIASDLGTSIETGLSQSEALKRLASYGPNALAEGRRVSIVQLLLNQILTPVMLLLVGAMALSAYLGDLLEAAAILAVLVVNAVIGFVAELRATRSIEALRKMNVLNARIRRDGALIQLPASQIVPGDCVILEAGDQVPADLRIATAANLTVDEALLTGESLPVGKTSDPVPAEARIHEQTSMLFRGTGVLTGSATGIAVATGGDTQLGTISRLVAGAEDEVSPLERNLARLTSQLIWLTFLIAVLIAGIGLWSGQTLAEMSKATIALTIATIPEGLPIVATLALARGLLRMARRNAVVRTLGAAETLGSTTVIMTDKTGTLTENAMSVERLITGDGIFDADELGEQSDMLLRPGILCSNASHDPLSDQMIGDPMEVAFLKAAAQAGIDAEALRNHCPRLREFAFDATRRMMATVHACNTEADDRHFVAVKGAPESVIAASTHVLRNGKVERAAPEAKANLQDQAARMAQDGYRMIALAQKSVDAKKSGDDPYRDLTLLCIVALRDPPRSDVRAALAACHEAGIQLHMITGDHPGTAQAIAAEVGIDPNRYGDVIRARVNPAEKLDLVTEQQDKGEIVAMTGDGVNDAPALRQADVGIAMGIRGTDVAREAADIVLLDDAFSTIVSAIREGRVIFRNIRRICIYLLSCNLGEVLLIAMALMLGMPLPLLPLQILFLNVVTDVFPAFALALGEGDAQMLKKPPRPPEERILTRRHWRMIGFHGVAIALASFVAFWVSQESYGYDAVAAATIAFLTIGFGQLWHVFSMRDPAESAFINSVSGNTYVWASLVLCTALLLATVYLPPLAAVLDIIPPNSDGWWLILACSLAPVALGQVSLSLRR